MDNILKGGGMTTTTDGQLNEVDLNAVGALVEAIKQRPTAAQTTWSLTATSTCTPSSA